MSEREREREGGAGRQTDRQTKTGRQRLTEKREEMCVHE